MTERSVVVGVSDSPANGRTLAWAVREAVATGAELVVTRADVDEPEVWGAVARGSLRALEIVDRTLARAVAAARARLGDQRVVIVVDRDPPGELLVRRAQPGGLLVLGAPGHPGWWARGSTTYYAATHAPCPVVVVHETGHETGHETRHETRHQDVDGVGPRFRDHVVVGVDGSAAAREALGFAFSFAAEHQRPLVAVTVLRHLHTDVWFDDSTLAADPDSDPDAAQALADELEPWRDKYPAVTVKRALVAGSPLDGLRRAAAGAELLAVGGAGGWPAALGSVSRGLVERAYCPVAIVREMP